MEVTAAAATIVQLISFTGQVLVAGYGFVSKVQRAPTEMSTLLREVANLNALLDQLQSLAEDSVDNPNLDVKSGQSALCILERLGVFSDCERLVKVVLNSVKACQQVEKQQVRNLGRRVMWPFKEKETKETMVQLGRLRDSLSAAVTADTMAKLRVLESITKEIDTVVITTLEAVMDTRSITVEAAKDIAFVKEKLQESMEDEATLTIRRWLYPDNIDVESSLSSALSTRHPMTGDWLLRSISFESWKTSELGCMWIYGIAGSGKTVLTSTIIQHLKQTLSSDCAIIYFFCDHRDPLKQNSQSFLHAVCKQLLEKNPAGMEEVRTWYNDRCNTKSTSEIRALTTKEYIELIDHLSMHWKHLYLAVDALDESSERKTFVDVLTQVTSSGHIKLIVTSRHEVDLERVVRPITAFPIDLKHHMSVDIKSFVYDEVKYRRLSGSLKCKDERLESNICSAIVQNSSDMILIAKLQLDFICRLKSERAIVEALSKLPSTVFQIYDDILGGLIQKYPDDVEDIGRILRWLVGSMVPLTLNQLAEAISIRPQDRYLDRSGIATDVLDLATCCGALVTVHDQGSLQSGPSSITSDQKTLITLSHASVEEYLKSGKMRPDLAERFPMDELLIDREIMNTCLQYIMFQDFTSPISISEIGSSEKLQSPPLHSNIRLRRLLEIRKSKYALLDYVSAYWPDHLRLTFLSSPIDDCTKALLGWFINWEQNEGTYISWQQIYHNNARLYNPEQPPLHYAIEFKLDNLALLLLNTKHDLDIGKRDRTALSVAARWGSLEVVKELLNRGVSLGPDEDDELSRGLTPLHNAAEGGHAEVIKLLLDHGASIHARSDTLTTPFYRAARSGSVQSLQLLYHAGSDINARTWDNFYPLIEALEHGHVEAAEQLLEWGADAQIILHDSNNVNALKMIAMQAFEDVTEEEILKQIQTRREKGPGAFQGFLKYLKPFSNW